ncbi:MAG TPA: hypothetical protein VMT24_15390, partial [Aggregatilineaceae bacterium]|jgi:hypothetical protein|nr:hypothetical protein [Aggregatilineaceae bacterium]
MDRYSRSITVALVLVLALAILALAAALVAPFDVGQPATVRSVTGAVDLVRPGESPVPLGADQDAPGALTTGQGLRLQPDSTVTLTFEVNQGYVVITGPAELKLVQSYRRATALGHVLDSHRFKRKYVLTIAQTQGSARYNFADTDPRFEDVEVMIRLPTSTYVPTTPCWTIDIATDGPTIVTPNDCPA